MPNLWFRVYSDFLTDSKMIQLAFEDQRHFFGILALKSDGTLDQNDLTENSLDRIVANRLWIDFAIVKEVKKRLVDVGLIDQKWQPIAWSRRQFKSDSSTERTRSYRERMRNSNNAASQERHSDALDTDTDTDTEAEFINSAETSQERHNDKSISFDDFYDAYPKKKDKQRAAKAWQKITDTDRAAIMADIQIRSSQDRSWLEGYIPHPTTYLNNRRWEDEIEQSRGGKQSQQQSKRRRE